MFLLNVGAFLSLLKFLKQIRSNNGKKQRDEESFSFRSARKCQGVNKAGKQMTFQVKHFKTRT